MNAKLDELVAIPVEKRNGVKTNFYAYKIMFVLDQLQLNDNQKQLVVDKLVDNFRKQEF